MLNSARSCKLQLLQTQYAFEPPVVSDDYGVRILKERFTARKLPDTILEVVDEVAVASGQRIAVEGKGTWHRLARER